MALPVFLLHFGTVGDDAHRAVGDQRIARTGQAAVVAIDNHGGRAAPSTAISPVLVVWASSPSIRVPTAAPPEIVDYTFVDNECVVAIDIQRRGVCAARRWCSGVIDNPRRRR